MDHQPHILIVDDSAIVRKALTRQLEQFGAHVTQAEDGQQGVEAALLDHFDLIISDVEMPHLDGFGLCEKLKDIPGTRGVPVIMLWARMTAVADTYHALISDRPYRRGMSHEQAMDIIENIRGTQLCPDCVDAFKESL